MIGLGFSLRDFVSNFVAGMSLGTISLIEKNKNLYISSITDPNTQFMKQLTVIDRQTSGVVVSEDVNVSVVTGEGESNTHSTTVYRFIPNSVLCNYGFCVAKN